MVTQQFSQLESLATGYGSDWPTLVVENIKQLLIDSNWWLINSKGDVKMVILVLMNLDSRTSLIEKRQFVTYSSTSPSCTLTWSSQLKRSFLEKPSFDADLERY